MLEFHQELFGLMSLAYCGSDTHHYGIVPIFSKDLAQIKRTNKLQQNFDKFPPMLITYMSYNKLVMLAAFTEGTAGSTEGSHITGKFYQR